MNTQQPFAPPVPPRQSRRSTEQVVSIVLASAGIGVTLIGMVLLLAMAAREGLLTPPVRVAGGAVLAGVLAGAASWIRPRPGGRVGSVALLATAAAAAFFDVIAVTRVYSWLPLAGGLALALIVGTAAAAQAVRWGERILFHAIVLGVAALAPVMTQGDLRTLTAFLIVVQLTGLVPEIRGSWDVTALVRTAPVVLAALGWVIASDESSAISRLWLAGIVAAVGLLSAVLAALVRHEVVYAVAALGISWLPLWCATLTCDRPMRALIYGAMFVVALLGAVMLRELSSLMRPALAVLAGVSGILCAVTGISGDWRAMPFLGAAVALVVAQLRSTQRTFGVVACVALVLGVILQGSVSSYLDLFYRSRVADLPISASVAGVLLLAFAIFGTLAVQGKNFNVDYVQCLLGMCGVAGVMGMALVVLTVTGASPSGFFIGHLALTVLSLMLAAIVLTTGLRHPRHLGASIAWGMTLVLCALIKLFLFDLHYMGAMTKAFTFVGAGLVLLAAGTLYARTYAGVASGKTTPQVSPNHPAMDSSS